MTKKEESLMHDPIARFAEWFADAKACAAIAEPTAMTVATATREGKPSARILLLKEHAADGFVFYTNFTSRKSHELTENPHAALCFYWMPLARQVRIEGRVVHVNAATADAYFASRDREKQIGAWASLQSQMLGSRAELEARIAEVTKKYEGKPIPRPPHWSGWRLLPERFEFWSQGDFRLHARDVYARKPDGTWQHALLYP